MISIPSSINKGYFIDEYDTYNDNVFQVQVNAHKLIDFISMNLNLLNYNTRMLVFYDIESTFRGTCFNGPVVNINDVKYKERFVCCAFLNDSTIYPFRSIPNFIEINKANTISNNEIFMFNIGKFMWHLANNIKLQKNTNGMIVSCYSTLINDKLYKQFTEYEPVEGKLNSYPYMCNLSGRFKEDLDSKRKIIYEKLNIPYIEKQYMFDVSNEITPMNPIITTKNTHLQ